MLSIFIPGKTRKDKPTWTSITGVPGGGDDNDKRYLLVEVADSSKCYQRISPETNELLVKFLDALHEDQKRFGEGANK